jgi:hypothetical protein
MVLFSMGTNIITHLQPKQSPSLQVATYLEAIFPYLPWTHCSLPQPIWLVFSFSTFQINNTMVENYNKFVHFLVEPLTKLHPFKGDIFSTSYFHLAFPHEFTSLWNQICYQLFQFEVFSKLKPWNVKFDMR